MQLQEIIKNSQNILIVAPKEMEGDNFCAALALFYTLNKLGKNVNLALPRVLEKLNFLATQEIFESLNQGNITISINTRGNKIEKILYEKNKKELNFKLDLKDGEVSVENISFKIKEKADLIISIENNEIFFKNQTTNSFPHPIISSNDLQIGVCDRVTDSLKNFDEKIIDKNIATCLLTGIISSTRNFQNKNTNPMVLEQASYLIERGADYQKIIQYLYKTKSLAEVKLFSRVLSHINFNKRKNIAWCSLSEEDFSETNSSSKNLSFVFEALKNNFSLPETIFILWKRLNSQPVIRGAIYSKKEDFIQTISDSFPSITKNNYAMFVIKSLDLKEAENNILNKFNLK